MHKAILQVKPSPTDTTARANIKRPEQFDVYKWLVAPSRFIPSVFFVGIAIALLICSAVGRHVSKFNCYQNFRRFHRYISPETFFYPTISQMLSIVESNTSPDQIIVIVGGNSIFFGQGQSISELWTVKLQQDLGRRFAVFNFAMPSADPFESAYWTSEALLKKHRKVIYATTAMPGHIGLIEGTDLYSYSYWDAHEKRLLCHDKDRERLVSARIKSLSEKDQQAITELQLRTKLDSLLYFQDLWTTIGYSKFFTVWTSLTAAEPWKARKDYEDKQVFPNPSNVRFRNPIDLKQVRDYIEPYFEPNSIKPNLAMWSIYSSQIKHAVPQPFKNNCLMVISAHAPASLAQLTKIEQTREWVSTLMSEECWKQGGYRCISMQNKLSSEDFLDSHHLLASGGRKVEMEVAPQVKKIARDLGF